MKAEKLEIKSENTKVSKQAAKQENRQPSVTGETGEKRKLPWELLFLFIVMGLTMIIIALKAFSII